MADATEGGFGMRGAALDLALSVVTVPAGAACVGATLGASAAGSGQGVAAAAPAGRRGGGSARAGPGA